jgi:hypothetical protein
MWEWLSIILVCVACVVSRIDYSPSFAPASVISHTSPSEIVSMNVITVVGRDAEVGPTLLVERDGQRRPRLASDGIEHRDPVASDVQQAPAVL